MQIEKGIYLLLIRDSIWFKTLLLQLNLNLKMSSNTNHDYSWKDSRLTCEYVPPDNYDERYDYDSLLLTTENAAFLTDESAAEIEPSAQPFDPELYLRFFEHGEHLRVASIVSSSPRSRSYCDDPSPESITCANCQEFESEN